jgi:hypothetical protein
MSNIQDKLHELMADSMPSRVDQHDTSFDNLYDVIKNYSDNNSIPPFTVFTVCMCFIETVLKIGKDAEAKGRGIGMEYLCSLITSTVAKYNPATVKDPTGDMVEACRQIWGMSRDEALEWLDSDAGVFIKMGGEDCWMCGSNIKSLLEKVAK